MHPTGVVAAHDRGAGQDPQARNPAADPDDAPEKQSELKLNAGIGIIGTILSLAVAVIFFFVEENIPLGIVFVVVALVAGAITARVIQRRRSAKPNQTSPDPTNPNQTSRIRRSPGSPPRPGGARGGGRTRCGRCRSRMRVRRVSAS